MVVSVRRLENKRFSLSSEDGRFKEHYGEFITSSESLLFDNMENISLFVKNYPNEDCFFEVK